MNPREITDRDLRYWADYAPRSVTYAADDPETSPCPAIITDAPDLYGVVGRLVVRVPWTLDEIELAHLAKGGTLWLSTWGGLPPHMIEVAAP